MAVILQSARVRYDTTVAGAMYWRGQQFWEPANMSDPAQRLAAYYASLGLFGPSKGSGDARKARPITAPL